MKSSIKEQLSTTTSEVLRDLGRNDGADRAWRKAAIKILIEKNHHYANHPDFRELRLEIEEEESARHEVESLVAQVKEEVQKVDEASTEFQVEHREDGNYHVPDHVGDTVKIVEPTGPFKAGFTTENMG